MPIEILKMLTKINNAKILIEENRVTFNVQMHMHVFANKNGDFVFAEGY